jgi:hypothetical protein
MITPVPCPWCKHPPHVGPDDPATEGSCVGRVECLNFDCPVKPFVRDDILVNDDRGSDAYKARAVERWNECAVQVSPVGGNELTAAEAAESLRAAMEIIEAVGTTGIYDRERAAAAWLKRYFPAYQ